MKPKCPCCFKNAVTPVVMDDDAEEWDANDTIYECQNCYAVVTLVVWDVEEDRVHVGILCVSPEDMGCTVILHMARNWDEAWEWADITKPDAVCNILTTNLN